MANTQTISVRNIPSELWRKFKMLALQEGKSASAHLVELISKATRGQK